MRREPSGGPSPAHACGIPASGLETVSVCCLSRSLWCFVIAAALTRTLILNSPPVPMTCCGSRPHLCHDAAVPGTHSHSGPSLGAGPSPPPARRRPTEPLPDKPLFRGHVRLPQLPRRPQTTALYLNSPRPLSPTAPDSLFQRQCHRPPEDPPQNLSNCSVLSSPPSPFDWLPSPLSTCSLCRGGMGMVSGLRPELRPEPGLSLHLNPVPAPCT